MLGELIKTARINKNMTTSDVSVVIGVSQGYISKIELDQKQPSLPLLEKLSETLEIPYDELLIASGYLDKSKYLGLIQENNQLRELNERLTGDLFDRIDYNGKLAKQNTDATKEVERLREALEKVMEVEASNMEGYETCAYKISRQALGGEAHE